MRHADYWRCRRTILNTNNSVPLFEGARANGMIVLRSCAIHLILASSTAFVLRFGREHGKRDAGACCQRCPSSPTALIRFFKCDARCQCVAVHFYCCFRPLAGINALRPCFFRAHFINRLSVIRVKRCWPWVRRTINVSTTLQPPSTTAAHPLVSKPGVPLKSSVVMTS